MEKSFLWKSLGVSLVEPGRNQNTEYRLLVFTGDRSVLIGFMPLQDALLRLHVCFLCRTRLDAPRLETKSLSSSTLPPSYASDRLSGNTRDPALKPKRSHRKADPDAAHRYLNPHRSQQCSWVGEWGSRGVWQKPARLWIWGKGSPAHLTQAWAPNSELSRLHKVSLRDSPRQGLAPVT